LGRVEVIPVPGIPEVEEGADIPALILKALAHASLRLEERDIVAVKQKIVSKAEGRIVRLDRVRPRARALRLARAQSKDPRLVELVLAESRRIVRAGHGVIITQTRGGFVCANSGVDQSNVKKGYAALLPTDPDASALRIRRGLEDATGRRLAVIITDTFGRPWRKGQTDVAIGASGIAPLLSYRGKRDRFGYKLRVTEPAVVDEVAGAAELATGKLDRIPVAVVRGVRFDVREGGLRPLIMEKERDLFR
jgi:coenzyme F420-0:L-glutamate ligase / coenzyme F420-1:gamma-L-glutamate ligase